MGIAGSSANLQLHRGNGIFLRVAGRRPHVSRAHLDRGSELFHTARPGHVARAPKFNKCELSIYLHATGSLAAGFLFFSILWEHRKDRVLALIEKSTRSYPVPLRRLLPRRYARVRQGPVHRRRCDSRILLARLSHRRK